MYVVFEAGGKQYRAQKDKIVRIEKISCPEGQLLEWPGWNLTEHGPKKATVKAEPIGLFKEPKVIIFKKKRRHNYRRKRGHRQELLWVKIKDIILEGEKSGA